MLVSSNIKRQNKNTVLGYLWWLLDPILMTGVYYVLVEVLFRRGDPKAPYLLFLLIGLLCWKAFASSIGQSVTMIISQGAIIKSISFPKAVLPLSIVLSNTIYFMIALIVAVGLALWYAPEWGCWPSIYYLMIPVVMGIQVLVTIGLSFIIATLGVFFQDMPNILSHILRMWYFLSPGLYSLDRVPDHLHKYFRLNPFCELMTSYRDIIIHGRMPAWYDLGYALLVGVVCCACGYLVFKRYEGRLVQKL